MTIEKIYKDLCNAINYDDVDYVKLLKLKENLEQSIRENTCYKTTSKTRINAIKKVASKDKSKPILSGYGVYNDYKVVTDSYHLIAIKQDSMPLKKVVNNLSEEKKLGKENCIFGIYPVLDRVINFNFDKDGSYKIYEGLDLNDMEAFYKMNKGKNGKLYPYKIDRLSCDINYLKNVIDVLGKDSSIYIPVDSDVKPIYVKNKDDELGLVLPIKTF